MRPEGPWQRLCRCPRGQQQVHFSAFSQIPSQAGTCTHPTLTGLPDLLLPIPARQKKKKKHTIIAIKEKKRQDLSSLPNPPTPSPPRPGQTLPPPAPRPLPRPTPPLPGRLWSLPQEPYAPCVVGWCLPPPSKLPGRPLGRTGIGPRSVRTAAVRAFRLPVSTGHRWSFVVWSPAQTTHLAAALQWGAIWPHPQQRLQKASGRTSS